MRKFDGIISLVTPRLSAATIMRYYQIIITSRVIITAILKMAAALVAFRFSREKVHYHTSGS